MKTMLIEAARNAFRAWLVTEENHTPEVRRAITEVAEGRTWLTVGAWTEKLKTEHGERLLRWRNIDDGLGIKLSP